MRVKLLNFVVDLLEIFVDIIVGGLCWYFVLQNTTHMENTLNLTFAHILPNT